MPVDMSIPNSIIQAFMSGTQLKNQREQTALEKERFEQQRKLEEEKLKTQKEQFEAEHKLVQQKFDLDKASHALQLLTQRQNIGKDITESGNIPPGVGDLTARPQGVGAPESISPDTLKLFAPELGGIFQVPSHESFAKRQLSEATALAEAKEAPSRLTELAKQRNQLYQTGLENEANRQSREKVAQIAAQSRIDAARTRGTSDSKARLANTFTQQFNSNPVVQNFDVIKRYTDFANNLDLKSGADDIGLVYAFSKVLDPNRVTSSEFDSAQKYAQTIANRYKISLERLSSNQGDFLSPDARENMLRVINNAYKINKAAYENVKKEHSKKFANISEDPNNWMSDHVGNDEVTSNPKVGDIVNIGGKKVKITSINGEDVEGEEVK